MPWPLDDKPVNPIANALLGPQQATATAPQGNAMASLAVQPSTISGPRFGDQQGATKEVLAPDGRTGTSAFLTVYPDKVEIHDINTHPNFQRQGYASALVDDLFREFPNKQIVAYGMTPRGQKFFGNAYAAGPDGILTPRSSERAIGAGILGGSFKGSYRTTE